MTVMKLVDKMLNFMGFEEEVAEEEDKDVQVEPHEEKSWLKKKDKEKEKGAVISMHA